MKRVLNDLLGNSKAKRFKYFATFANVFARVFAIPFMHSFIIIIELFLGLRF